MKNDENNFHDVNPKEEIKRIEKQIKRLENKRKALLEGGFYEASRDVIALDKQIQEARKLLKDYKDGLKRVQKEIEAQNSDETTDEQENESKVIEEPKKAEETEELKFDEEYYKNIRYFHDQKSEEYFVEEALSGKSTSELEYELKKLMKKENKPKVPEKSASMPKEMKKVDNHEIVKYFHDQKSKEYFAEKALSGKSTSELENKLKNLMKKEDKSDGVFNTQSKVLLPKVAEFPKLNLYINKKTGRVILQENDDIEYTMPEMNSDDYTKKGLKKIIDSIKTNENVSDGDEKYLKYVDPTIYKAYLNWDICKSRNDYKQSASKMYVQAVINQAKNLENKEELSNVEMPGEVFADIGWHVKEHNERKWSNAFKGIKNIITSHRANKILKQNKKMELAEVKDNRLKRLLFSGAIGAMFGAVLFGKGKKNDFEDSIKNGSVIGSEIPGREENSNQNRTLVNLTKVGATIGTELSEYLNKENNEPNIKEPNVTDNEENNNNHEQEDNSQKPTIDSSKYFKVYSGDIVKPKQYAFLFADSDSKEANGALGNVNQPYGVNKMAVIVGDDIYTSTQYSQEQLNEILEKNPDAKIRCHIDKAVEMNGKWVVETHEVGNPAPVYLYNDNGVMKTLDGREWKGDVEYGVGWMEVDSLEKVQEIEASQMQENMKQQKQRDFERER